MDRLLTLLGATTLALGAVSRLLLALRCTLAEWHSNVASGAGSGPTDAGSSSTSPVEPLPATTTLTL
jgi:hypothetical protein